MKPLIYTFYLLFATCFTSCSASAATVINSYDIKNSIYVIKLNKNEIYQFERGYKVDIRLPNADLILDGKILSVKKNKARLKVFDTQIKFPKGTRLIIKNLQTKSSASRFYISKAGVGLSTLLTVEYHSNTDIMYGLLASFSFLKELDLEFDGMLGVHNKVNGQTVAITSLSGKLKFFPLDFLSIAAGAKYKLYSLDKPKLTAQQIPGQSPTATAPTTSAATENPNYPYHDESNIYLTASAGLRYDTKKAAIGRGFSLAIDAGVDFIISEVQETIPGFNPLDEDLLQLDPSMTLWGKLSMGYFF